MLCDECPYFGVYEKYTTTYCIIKDEIPQYVEKFYDETHLSSRKIRLTATDYKKKKFRNRKNSENKYKAHLKFLSDNLKRYPSSVYPVDQNGKPSEKWNFQNGSYTLGEIARYKRCWLSKKGHGNLAGYYKKMANRAVRRGKTIIHRGCSYKKVYDYRWYIIQKNIQLEMMIYDNGVYRNYKR